jgi:hypothetical protein
VLVTVLVGDEIAFQIYVVAILLLD